MAIHFSSESGCDDGGFSRIVAQTNTINLKKDYTMGSSDGKEVQHKIVKNGMTDSGKDPFRGIRHSNGIFYQNEIDLFNKTYRFGVLDPYENLGGCREYLFFTKPDLNIYPRDNDSGVPSKSMHEYLQTLSFWNDMELRYQKVLKLLQYSRDTTDPFNHLLQNSVQSNLDVPSMTAEMIDTPNNAYGVGYKYRGSSESSDDSFEFSLEFKDTKDLNLYRFFKAYEDYETIKHHGNIMPWIPYIRRKILYDQYAIFKFMIDMDDAETIIYWGKYYGVKSKSLPRDVFSNGTFDNGLSYSIDFGAAFFDELKPQILAEFNELSRTLYNSQTYQIRPFNLTIGRVDNRPAKAAFVVSEYSKKYGHYVYKLRWRGSDRY